MISSPSETQIFKVLTTEHPGVISVDGLRSTVGRKISPFHIVRHCLGSNLANRAERHKLGEGISNHQNGDIPPLRVHKRAQKSTNLSIR